MGDFSNEDRTILDRLHRHAREQPDHVAYKFQRESQLAGTQLIAGSGTKSDKKRFRAPHRGSRT
jgi:hypothetical protein